MIRAVQGPRLTDSKDSQTFRTDTKETTKLLGSSAEPFASMEEAHRFGLLALARLSN